MGVTPTTKRGHTTILVARTCARLTQVNLGHGSQHCKLGTIWLQEFTTAMKDKDNRRMNLGT